MTPSHCPKCGNPLRKNAAFCGYCGSDVNAPAETELPTSQPTPVPAQPEGEVCQFCGKPLRAGARFCAGCGKSVAQPDTKGEPTEFEEALLPPTPEDAAPLEFPLSGLQEALDEPQVEFEAAATPEPEKPDSIDEPPMAISKPNSAKQAHFRKIWIGVGCLVLLVVMAVQILPGLFARGPSELPDATALPSLPVVASATEVQPTPESTPEVTAAPTKEPTPQPTALPFTATLDLAMVLPPLTEDFSTKPLSSDWVKTGVVGAVIETMDETRGGVLRLNSDLGKGILAYSPALSLTSGLKVQFTLVSFSSAFAVQMYDSETQVAMGAVPLMAVQFRADTSQVILLRPDGAEVSLPFPPVDGKQGHLAAIIIGSDGSVRVEIDGTQVFVTTSDLMAVPPSGKVRFGMTGSAVIDDLQIQIP